MRTKPSSVQRRSPELTTRSCSGGPGSLHGQSSGNAELRAPLGPQPRAPLLTAAAAPRDGGPAPRLHPPQVAAPGPAPPARRAGSPGPRGGAAPGRPSLPSAPPGSGPLCAEPRGPRRGRADTASVPRPPRTHPSPTTTHLMACIVAAERGGAGSAAREGSRRRRAPQSVAAASALCLRAGTRQRPPPTAGRENCGKQEAAAHIRPGSVRPPPRLRARSGRSSLPGAAAAPPLGFLRPSEPERPCRAPPPPAALRQGLIPFCFAAV